MNPVVKASVILAAAVAVCTVVFLAAGFHETPMLGMVFLVVVIGLNIGMVIWALKRTAADSGYGKQLMNGAIIGVLAGILIMVASFVLQSFVFPNSLQEARDATVAFMEGIPNIPEAKLDETVAKLDAATPMSEAAKGLAGTFGTSLIVAAIAAIFLRKK